MKCNTCGHATSTSRNSLYLDCGGDCLLCMAKAGDEDCTRHVVEIADKYAQQLEIVKTNLYRGMGRNLQRLQARSIEQVLRGDWD